MLARHTGSSGMRMTVCHVCRSVPRMQKEDRVLDRDSRYNAVPEMEVGSPESPCRGRLQTTASCAGQEPLWRTLRTRCTTISSGVSQEGECERTTHDGWKVGTCRPDPATGQVATGHPVARGRTPSRRNGEGQSTDVGQGADRPVRAMRPGNAGGPKGASHRGSVGGQPHRRWGRSR